MKDKKITFDYSLDYDSSVGADYERAVDEMRDIRGKLGNFSLRFMMEAVYGDEYAKTILGESGGEILMRDINFTAKRVDGGIASNIDLNQLRKILTEAHPNKSSSQIDAMLSNQSGKAKKKQKKALTEQSEKMEEESLVSYLADLDDNERKAVLDYIKIQKRSKK
jgi:hypothetical protein